MVARTEQASPRHHPAGKRHSVDAWALGFGLVGAPAIWSLHLIVNYALTSEVCSPGGVQAGTDTVADIQSTLLLNNAATLIIAALATFVAYGCWRAVQNEEHGSHHHLLEVGEGRTRFLAMVGMILGGGFFAATVFDTLAVLTVPICA